MTQNLLVQRFKDAKKELTALKTTHLRGIGNLKIYKETITFRMYIGFIVIFMAVLLSQKES